MQDVPDRARKLEAHAAYDTPEGRVARKLLARLRAEHPEVFAEEERRDRRAPMSPEDFQFWANAIYYLSKGFSRCGGRARWAFVVYPREFTLETDLYDSIYPGTFPDDDARVRHVEARLLAWARKWGRPEPVDGWDGYARIEWVLTQPDWIRTQRAYFPWTAEHAALRERQCRERARNGFWAHVLRFLFGEGA